MTIFTAFMMLPITASAATLIGAVLAPRPAIGLFGISIGSALLTFIASAVLS